MSKTTDTPEQAHDVKTTIGYMLQRYPALNADFYQEGEMDKLKAHDLRNEDSTHVPLAGLPARFQEILTKLPGVSTYIASINNAPPHIISSDPRHASYDGIGKDNKAASGYYRKEQQEAQALYRRYLSDDGLKGLFKAASQAEHYIDCERKGNHNHGCYAGNTLGATQDARELMDAHLKAAGTMAPRSISSSLA